METYDTTRGRVKDPSLSMTLDDLCKSLTSGTYSKFNKAIRVFVKGCYCGKRLINMKLHFRNRVAHPPPQKKIKRIAINVAL